MFMPSDEGAFWDQRYRLEGAIWGNDPSPTARLAAQHIAPGARVLEVGFGYGRDLAYYLHHSVRVCGIELSVEGYRQALNRLQQADLQPESLQIGRFEEQALPEGAFDVLVCHRVAHLFVEPAAMLHFAAKARQVLRAGGLLCLGARNLEDLNPADMIEVADHVYEYRQRPGHRIRYWADATFENTFADDFRILSLTRATEPESMTHPAACRLTIMVGQKKVAAPQVSGERPPTVSATGD